MQIVESQKDIETFQFYWNSEESMVIPIWCDLEKHPMNNKLSFLYVRFRDAETDQGDTAMDFIIPFNHNDCEIPKIDLSISKQKKLLWNRKGLLQSSISLANTEDFHAHYFFKTNEHIDLQEITELLTSFYNKVGLRNELGKIIPIMKFGQILRKFTNQYISLISDIEDTWVNSSMIPTLSRLESKGINVDPTKFFERWPSSGKHLKNNKIYTEYNPYTTTSRPSNRHGGINFGALNKSDGTRECFIPEAGNVFLQFDYDAYHVRLIADMISYDIPKDIAGHQWLADLYGTTYDDGKKRTFRILYGGPTKEDIKIPFFKEVDIYINNLWKDVQETGYVKTPYGRKILLKWIDSPTPQKVFNYLLQATETEYNISIMASIFIAGIDSLVMYSYDAFLFDVPKDITAGKLLKLRKLLESNGFPVKHSIGNNYSEV